MGADSKARAMGWRPAAHARAAGAAAWLAALTPTDRMTLAFLAALAVVALARHPQPAPLVAAATALAAGLGAAAWARSRSRFGSLVHDFFPIVSLLVIFDLAGPLIAAANPARWDETLAVLDRRLFGALPAAWLGLLGRPWWLTDAASIAYVSYYVIPVAIGVALWVEGRRGEFEWLAFTVVATFLLSYACYFLMPTSGPRVPVETEDAVLGGSGMSVAVRAFLRVAEGNQLDAFPSGHTAVSLVTLTLGWRLLPRWRVPLVLLVAGILFSTVYLSLHYVVDIVAGALLAALVPLVLPLLRRCLARNAGVPDGR